MTLQNADKIITAFAEQYTSVRVMMPTHGGAFKLALYDWTAPVDGCIEKYN